MNLLNQINSYFIVSPPPILDVLSHFKQTQIRLASIVASSPYSHIALHPLPPLTPGRRHHYSPLIPNTLFSLLMWTHIHAKPSLLRPPPPPTQPP